MSNQDNEKLLSDLNAANKKIEHLSEVLNESESTNLRLSEQVRVLKEEVRRLERNKEREQHAENLEYLKNVFIKFATLSPCSEKAMLIPVLTTMLKLSPAEQQQLKSISGDIDGDESSTSGWGSYLHRWSGLA
ncbi:GRIP and coiled-coil domain-containing protein 2 [Araneus ventricosus]|nr:GRIP and coiled-coil domain-containing protein 2 [Araneus ventricosus]GBM73801.1 GRIP and coiled-coil domain-containing protein 2 [Araneus ventricosus]